MPSSRSAPRVMSRPAAIRCSCGSCSRRCRRRTCGPTGLTPTRFAKSVRARCRAPCSCGWRGCRPTPSRSRAPSRCWATAPACPPSRQWPRPTSTASRSRARALAGAEILRRGAAARLRAPAGARRRLPRPRRGGARAAARARGKSPRLDLGAAPELVAAQLLAAPSPRRAVGRDAAARRGPGGAAPRCDRERGAVPAAGARGAAPGGASASSCCWSSGWWRAS